MQSSLDYHMETSKGLREKDIKAKMDMSRVKTELLGEVVRLREEKVLLEEKEDNLKRASNMVSG